MKTCPHSRPENSGSILLVTLMLSAILGVMLASFLTLTRFQINSVARSQTWNQSMVNAEAGVEEALAMINLYAYGAGDLSSWSTVATANGWQDRGGGVFYLVRTNGLDYYEIYITNAP